MKVLSQLVYIEPNKEEGFNFGYFIKISNRGTNNKLQLIGECNNCGIVNEENEAYKKTLWEIEYNGLICKTLQSKLECSAIILPCFTRPMSEDGKCNIYTHMLTSQAIKTDVDSIKRVDQQYANMIHHAKKLLSKLGFEVNNKIIMTGFSASSKFAQRFALLYPELVSCVIAGGMSAVPCLPMKEFKGEILHFPLGVHDYQELMQKPFNEEEYRKMKQYLIMGDSDENDPVKYVDCVTEEEREIIYKIYDENMQKRWAKMVDIIKKLNLTNVHTYLIKGVANSTKGIDSIIEKNLNEIIKSSEIDSCKTVATSK